MRELAIAPNSEDSWFYEKPEKWQRAYIVKHPGSKFAKIHSIHPIKEKSPVTKEKKPIHHKLKEAYKNFSKEQKEFFRGKGYEPNSEERRKAAKLLKDKSVGIVKALKHESGEWKLAANSLRKLKNGEKLDHHDKKALKSVLIHLGIVSADVVLAGGLHHGLAVAIPHLVKGMVTHSLAVNTAKSGIYASSKHKESDDELLEELVNHFIHGLQKAPIKKEDWIKAIDKHNRKIKGKKNA